MDRFTFSYASVDEKIILKWILNIMGKCGLDNVVQNRAKLRAVCLMLRNFGFPQKAVNFLTKLLLDSPEGFSFMKLASAFVYLAKFMNQQYLRKSVLFRTHKNQA
jgi:hypothetical protein